MLRYQFEDGILIGLDELQERCKKVTDNFFGSMVSTPLKEVEIGVPGSIFELKYDKTPITGSPVMVRHFKNDVLQLTCILPASTAKGELYAILLDSAKTSAFGVSFC